MARLEQVFHQNRQGRVKKKALGAMVKPNLNDSATILLAYAGAGRSTDIVVYRVVKTCKDSLCFYNKVDRQERSQPERLAASLLSWLDKAVYSFSVP